MNGTLTDIKDIAPILKFLVTQGWWYQRVKGRKAIRIPWSVTPDPSSLQISRTGYGFLALQVPGAAKVLASDHKYLRLCDLCKELVFGGSHGQSSGRDFIQLVRVQPLVPPVPGENLPKTGSCQG